MTDTRAWPDSMAEIAGLIGPEAAMRLVDAYGGTRCYVPRRPAAKGPLAQAIGLDQARVLAENYGGEYLLVPTLFVARAKKRRIAEAHGSAAQVARRYGVTERWVREVRNDEGDERQGLLFAGGTGSG